MTVKVRAGTTTAELQRELASRGQRTALPERGGTVGGALAVGENHPEMLGRGALRSSLLQVRYISAEGRVVNGGGPTVKNVTGFDLPRLMVGALGTLGLLAEVILRTNPIPPVRRWFAADDADPFDVHDALLRPGALFWNGRRTWVLLEGHRPDVLAELAELAGHGKFEEVDGGPDLPPQRWSLSPSRLRTTDLDPVGPFVAAIGSGLVFASVSRPTRETSPTVRALTARIKQNFDPTGRLNPGRDVLPG
jgi:glycolate oxidase FAD binding subunit